MEYGVKLTSLKLVFFPKVFFPKMNVIARLEFENAYFDAIAPHFGHWVSGTPFSFEWIKIKTNVKACM